MLLCGRHEDACPANMPQTYKLFTTEQNKRIAKAFLQDAGFSESYLWKDLGLRRESLEQFKQSVADCKHTFPTPWQDPYALVDAKGKSASKHKSTMAKSHISKLGGFNALKPETSHLVHRP